MAFAPKVPFDELMKEFAALKLEVEELKRWNSDLESRLRTLESKKGKVA